MSKLVEWLKQLLTELDNVQMQRRLDKQWEIYQEEELTWSRVPVAKRAVQGKSAAELTAKMWAKLAGAGVIEKIVDNNVSPYETKTPIKIVVKRKNDEKFMRIVDKYTTEWKEI